MKSCLVALLWLFLAGGVSAQRFDIPVTDQVVMQRCVTPEIPRSIAVGMPGGFNYVFDAVQCRLAYVWFGGFLDFRPEATGRGGRPLPLLGVKRSIGETELPLRIGESDRLPERVQFDGYRRDEATGMPTFLFHVDGVPVEQRVLSFAADQVTVEFAFPEAGNAKRYFLADQTAFTKIDVSEGLRMVSPKVVEIPADMALAQIRLTLPPSDNKFVRQKPTTNGRLLYALHCMSCHTLDGGKRIGPSFASLWTASRVVTRNGRREEVVADEAYVRESILRPQVAIVQGYEKANQMVDVTQTLDEEQIESLVQFLLGLKPSAKEGT